MSLLRDRKREKALRHRVRAEVRASPALKKERRRVKKLVARPFPESVIWRPFLACWLSGLAVQAPDVEWILALATLWSLGFLLIRTAALGTWLYARPDLLVLAHLPVPGQVIFRRQWRGFLRESGWTWLDLSVLYGIAAMRVGFGGNAVVVGIGLGGLHWLTVCAVVCLVAQLWRHGAHYYTGIGICLFTLGFGMGANHFAHALGGLVDALLWVPPAGLIAYSLGISPPDAILMVIWPAIFLGVWLASFQGLLQRLQRRFLAFDNSCGATEFLLIWTGDTRTATEPSERAQAKTISITLPAKVRSASETIYPEQSPSLRDREQVYFDWAQGGWVERLVRPIFTPREQVLIEFMEGADLQWSKAYRSAVGALAFGLALLWIFPSWVLVLFFLAILPAGFMIPALREWRGLNSITTFGQASPMYAGYPIHFQELARVVIKLSLVQTALLAPWVMVFLAIGLKLTGDDFSRGLIWAVKGIALVIAALPACFVWQISQKTTECWNWWQKTLAVVFAIVVLAAVGIAVIHFFNTSRPLNMLAVLAGIAIFTWTCLRVYGQFFNRGAVDLIHPPSTS